MKAWQFVSGDCHDTQCQFQLQEAEACCRQLYAQGTGRDPGITLSVLLPFLCAFATDVAFFFAGGGERGAQLSVQCTTIGLCGGALGNSQLC